MISKALRLGMACVALLGLAACGNNSRPMIMVMDGSGPDAGTMTGTDSGMMTGRDSGMMMSGTCGSVAGATGWPPMPASCTPRCSMATLEALSMCMDAACQDMALMSDTTPSANLDAGGMMPIEVDCELCVNWQGNSCVYDACPMEFGAYLECFGMAMNPDTECMTQEMALNTCAMTNEMAINTCYVGTMSAPGRVYDCFFGGGGIGDGARGPGASRVPAEVYSVPLRFDLSLMMSIAR